MGGISMGRGKLAIAAALAATGAFALPSQAASCGGLLQPSCPPPPGFPNAPDPGGDGNAGLPVPPSAGKRFGFNTNLWWQTSGGRDMVPFEVDRSVGAGAQVIRTTVTWATFSSAPDKPLGTDGQAYPQRGTIPDATALERLDELYDRASARGIQLDLIVNNAPKWASAYSYC